MTLPISLPNSSLSSNDIGVRREENCQILPIIERYNGILRMFNMPLVVSLLNSSSSSSNNMELSQEEKNRVLAIINIWNERLNLIKEENKRLSDCFFDLPNVKKEQVMKVVSNNKILMSYIEQHMTILFKILLGVPVTLKEIENNMCALLFHFCEIQRGQN